LWALNLPLPVAAMRALTEGIDGAIQEYAMVGRCKFTLC
jgi:hypothetical protein